MVKKLGYEKALKKVFAVRLERQKIYGDCWKNTKDYRFVGMIMEKAERLERLMENDKLNNYEKVEDTLIDIVNYALFLLEKKSK